MQNGETKQSVIGHVPKKFTTMILIVILVVLSFPSLTFVNSFPYPLNPPTLVYNPSDRSSLVSPILSSFYNDDFDFDDDETEEELPVPNETAKRYDYRSDQPPQKNIMINNNSRTQSKRRSILLIDDDPSILNAVSKYLAGYGGYAVATASDADRAMAYLDSLPLREYGCAKDEIEKEEEEGNDGADGYYNNTTEKQYPFLPSAIVSDVRMPGSVDGLGFVSLLRSSSSSSSNSRERDNPEEQQRRQRYYRSVPVVLLTAKGSTNDRIEGYKTGADAYLPKPFDPEELLGMLEGLIQREEMLRTVVECTDDDDSIHDFDDGSGTTMEKEGMKTTTTTPTTSVVFSPDELNVLELLCRGGTNKEIAMELQYSVRWVELRLTSMYRKTGCGKRTQLVRWAVAEGYVDPF